MLSRLSNPSGGLNHIDGSVVWVPSISQMSAEASGRDGRGPGERSDEAARERDGRRVEGPGQRRALDHVEAVDAAVDLRVRDVDPASSGRRV